MLAGVLIALSILVALLAIPVTLTFHIAWRDALHSDIALTWAFGLVHLRLPSGERTPPAPRRREDNNDHTTRSGAPKPAKLFAAIRVRRFRRRMLRFAADLWRALHKRDLHLHVRLGLGDPAETGQLWGMLGPGAGLLSGVSDASISVEPDFLDATLELDGSGRIRVMPLRLLGLASALLLSPSVWQGLKRMRTAG